MIVDALRESVVPLIQDLNGNHVIQKCLNQFVNKDSQFIYDAVTTNCVHVASHRHGCCVLQRCIDYASPIQRVSILRCCYKGRFNWPNHKKRVDSRSGSIW
jgi:hypothetical protein